jgi:hypothetical protein
MARSACCGEISSVAIRTMAPSNAAPVAVDREAGDSAEEHGHVDEREDEQDGRRHLPHFHTAEGSRHSPCMPASGDAVERGGRRRQIAD